MFSDALWSETTVFTFSKATYVTKLDVKILIYIVAASLDPKKLLERILQITGSKIKWIVKRHEADKMNSTLRTFRTATSYNVYPNKGPAEMGSHSFQRTFEWERLYSDNYPWFYLAIFHAQITCLPPFGFVFSPSKRRRWNEINCSDIWMLLVIGWGYVRGWRFCFVRKYLLVF